MSKTIASASHLIPHTLARHDARPPKVGDRVNIETDVLAKYVERQL